MRKLLLKLFPRYRRLELRFCSYAEADKLLRETQGKEGGERWQLATPEEDKNHTPLMVYLERKERILE